MNMLPIDCRSKKHGTIESSVFGAEFVAAYKDSYGSTAWFEI
jgi:hypothetical protein